MPVILVLSRPATGEAYYVVVKEYFADAGTRAKRRITFDKKLHAFPDDPQVLLDVARRDANRRSLAANALLEGPMATLGLSNELKKAERATEAARAKSTKARWRKAAKLWDDLAAAIAASGVPRRLVWPALEQRHYALREAGDKLEAATARLELAKDKIRLDDATAWHDLAGLEWLIDPDVLGFELQLASAQANWFELGAEALDPLRELVDDTSAARPSKAIRAGNRAPLPRAGSRRPARTSSSSSRPSWRLLPSNFIGVKPTSLSATVAELPPAPSDAQLHHAMGRDPGHLVRRRR